VKFVEFLILPSVIFCKRLSCLKMWQSIGVSVWSSVWSCLHLLLWELAH